MQGYSQNISLLRILWSYSWRWHRWTCFAWCRKVISYIRAKGARSKELRSLDSINCFVNIRLCIMESWSSLVWKSLWESYGRFLLCVCNYITTCLKATTKFSRVSGRTELNGILGHMCSKTFYYRMGTMIKEKPNSKSWQQHTPRECWKHTSKNKLQWVRHLVIERIASRAASEWELLEWNRRGRSVLSINSIDCCIQSLAQ